MFLVILHELLPALTSLLTGFDKRVTLMSKLRCETHYESRKSANRYHHQHYYRRSRTRPYYRERVITAWVVLADRVNENTKSSQAGGFFVGKI